MVTERRELQGERLSRISSPKCQVQFRVRPRSYDVERLLSTVPLLPRRRHRRRVQRPARDVSDNATDVRTRRVGEHHHIQI